MRKEEIAETRKNVGVWLDFLRNYKKVLKCLEACPLEMYDYEVFDDQYEKGIQLKANIKQVRLTLLEFINKTKEVIKKHYMRLPLEERKNPICSFCRIARAVGESTVPQEEINEIFCVGGLYKEGQ